MGKGVSVSIGGKSYELVYTLGALIAFTERFGGLDEMVEQTQGPEILDTDTPEEAAVKEKARRKAKARFFAELPWLIATLANQGIALSAHKGKVENLTPDMVGLLVMPRDFWTLANEVMEAIRISSTPEHAGEDNGKPKDAFLEEYELKNVQGAAE